LLAFAAIIIRPFAVVFYGLIKLLRPARHKITFISRQSDATPVDFSLLISELSHQDRSATIKVLCCSDATRSKRFLGTMRQTICELWHIANSAAVVLDGYALSVSYFPQRKNLYVLQMWHALGAVKRFSWQAVDTPGGRSARLARALRMHANYTAVLTGGEASREIFRHAFRVARTRIHALPLPRVDMLRAPDVNRLDLLISHNQELFKATPLILYAPTFRDTAQSSHRWLSDFQKLLAAVEDAGATLILSNHLRSHAGLNKHEVDALQSPSLIVKEDLDTLDLLAIVDHVITDYSAVSFEAATAGKPVWFYVPDYDDYVAQRGLNIDLRQILPGACFANPQELMAELAHQQLPTAAQEAFRREYVQDPPKPGVTSAQQVARLILQGIQ